MERVFNFFLKEEELKEFYTYCGKECSRELTCLGNFEYVLHMTESDMNKAIRLIDDKASSLYIGSGGSFNTSVAASLLGAFRRCMKIG